MALYYRTLCFVFKKIEKGEADIIFKVYSKDFGKIEILAKGIRKISSKLRYQIDLFTFCEIHFVEGKNKVLIETRILKEFKKIRKNLKGLILAFRISEIFDKLVMEGNPERKIWLLLFRTFKYLDSCYFNKAKLYLIYQYFIWNLLSYLGYKPQLRYCIYCQKFPKDNKLYFSEEGGIVCQKCKVKSDLSLPINLFELRFLREVLRKDLGDLIRTPIKLVQVKNLNRITKKFLKKILEKQ